MKVTEIDPTQRRDRQVFLDLPFRIYQGIPQWVPPLEMDARRQLDPGAHPFYQHSQAAFFLAEDTGRYIGRLAVLENRHYNEYNHEHSAFFYLFECEDNPPAARELFAAGEEWACNRGLDRIIGPKGFTALDGMGLLVEGFEHRPALGIPYNPAYYPALIEAAGFRAAGETVSGYLSRNLAFPAKIHEVSRLVQERKGLSVSRFRKRGDLYKVLPKIRDLYNGAVEGTTGNTPLTDDEALTMADQLLWFADPKLIKIIFKGEQPVGFLFAYPDISEALQRTRGRLFPFGWADILLELRRTKWLNINGMGLVEQYRGMGGTALLFSEMYKTIQESRFEHIDVVQIGVENDRMQNEMSNFGVKFYKKHRMYEKRLQVDSNGS
jgi:hypothetical protein